MAATIPSPILPPTDNYDIQVVDSDGVDIFGGELANRDTTNPEQATPKIGSTYGPRRVTGSLTVKISGLSAHFNKGKIILYFEPAQRLN